MSHRRAVIFAAILALGVALDQGTKAWARTLPVSAANTAVQPSASRGDRSGAPSPRLGAPVSPAGCDVPGDLIARRCHGVPQPVIDGYWDWELAFNTGAAFSSFRGGQLALGALAGAALIALGAMAWRARPEQRLRRIALAVIAGGALGNLIDRVRDGAVTDFVRWRAGEARWPIFNVADAALLIGVGLMLVESIAEWRAERRRAAA